MKRVVIIGGGYAGIYALGELVRNKNIKITLIDKHTYHNLQPEVYDLIANNSTFADVTIDLTTLCKGFDHDHLDFKNLKVRKIDQQAKKIYTEEQEIVEFDYLILAAGTRTFFPSSIPGLNNADDIKKLHRAITFKQSFETHYERHGRNIIYVSTLSILRADQSSRIRQNNQRGRKPAGINGKGDSFQT